MEECYFLVKVRLPHGCFSRFLNCTNGTRLPNLAALALILIKQTFKVTFSLIKTKSKAMN